jgi:hypothetical protein
MDFFNSGIQVINCFLSAGAGFKASLFDAKYAETT